MARKNELREYQSQIRYGAIHNNTLHVRTGPRDLGGGLKQSVKPKNRGGVAAGEEGVRVVCFRGFELVAGTKRTIVQARDFRPASAWAKKCLYARDDAEWKTSEELSALRRHLATRPLNWNGFSVVAWIERFFSIEHIYKAVNR